jgi:hypothetical protein
MTFNILPFRFRDKNYVSFSLSRAEAIESLLSDDSSFSDKDISDSPAMPPPFRWSFVFLLLTTHLIAILITSLFLLYLWNLPFNLNKVCSLHTSQYSPILDKVAMTYTTQQFPSVLFDGPIYIQEPSAAVDKAWSDDLGVHLNNIRVPSELALRSGYSGDEIKINSKYGGGYIGIANGFHTMHCLNLLRKTLWWNYPYYKNQGQMAFGNEDITLKRHTRKCI